MYQYGLSMMNINEMKERFSFAYIEAIASRAGCWLADPRVDRDSVDGILMGESEGRPSTIHFQAKATAQDVLKGGNLNFHLPMKNYNDLRADTRVPRILIVLRMPDEIGEWLNQTDDELCQRYCAYWLSLKGSPTVPNTHNITVQIPTTNMFSSEQLTDLMAKVERGEAL